MSQPQPTGFMFPQTPMPFQTRYPTLITNTASQLSDIASAIYQARGGLGVSTMRTTASVIRANGLSPSGSRCQMRASLGSAARSREDASPCQSFRSPTAAMISPAPGGGCAPAPCRWCEAWY